MRDATKIVWDRVTAKVVVRMTETEYGAWRRSQEKIRPN